MKKFYAIDNSFSNAGSTSSFNDENNNAAKMLLLLVIIRSYCSLERKKRFERHSLLFCWMRFHKPSGNL